MSAAILANPVSTIEAAEEAVELKETNAGIENLTMDELEMVGGGQICATWL